ncbi:helix-turn-helix domain-containing protein [Paenibacillus sp. YYML68]|uniref:helix-turn-helix domain-containing protein n=1 Tax=Paenibacillus sp. YYML68 TaxID=2909250 RepID=UPI00249252D0|nr:helix-turn-helix domain-containing protein [Paenibacillus sp. YYML68]
MIGKRIQYYRNMKRLSLTELAYRAGVAKSYLSSIERNIQSNPSVDFLNKICKALGIDISVLIKDTDHEAAQVASLDQEWLRLAQEVQASGMSVEEVRQVLSQYR